MEAIKMRFVGIALLLLLAVGEGAAQHAGLNITLESIKPVPANQTAALGLRPLDAPLESILGDEKNLRGWEQGKANPDLYKFNVEWGAADGLVLRQNLTQERLVGVKNAPLNEAMRTQLQQSFSLAPFSGMNFSMQKTTTETVDYGMVLHGANQVEVMGLSQTYGSGTSVGSMGFTRTETDTFAAVEGVPFAPLALVNTTTQENFNLAQGFGLLGQAGKLEYARGLTTVSKPNEHPTEQASDTFRLQMPLWAQMNFSGVYERSHADLADGKHRQHRGFELARSFSSGDAKLSYDNISDRLRGANTETTTQGFVAPFSILDTPTTLAFSAKTVQRNGARMSDARNASLATQFAGNALTSSWTRNMVSKGGAEHKTTNMAFALPIDFYDEKIQLNFTSAGTQVNKALTAKKRTASVSVPLSHFRKGSSLTHVVQGAMPKPGQPYLEVRTTKLLMPFAFLGSDVASEFQRIVTRAPSGKTMQFVSKAAAPVTVLGRRLATEHQYVATNRPGGVEQNQLHTKVIIPFKPGPAVITRLATTDIAADGTERQTRTTTVAGPRVPLGDKASVQADAVARDLPGNVDHHIAHFNLQTTPLPRMTVGYDYRIQDLGYAQDTKQRRVDTSYALNQRLSLNARYLEREQLDRSPFIQKTLVLQHANADAADLRLRAALTDTNTGAVDGELMKLIEIGYGDPRVLGLTVAYQEYDEKKLACLGDPIIRLGLQHGNPSSVNWAFSYEDSNARAEPYRRYGVGFPMGDALVRFELTQNAVDRTDPKKQRVRLADAYDLTVSRRIFGDVDLDLAFRYLDESATAEEVDQWLKVQLSGGKVERGGAIQLGFAQGDFIPLAKKLQDTPATKLNMTYERTWSEAGNVSLHLDRTTMPDTVRHIEDTYEGRLQFQYSF